MKTKHRTENGRVGWVGVTLALAAGLAVAATSWVAVRAVDEAETASSGLPDEPITTAPTTTDPTTTTDRSTTTRSTTTTTAPTTTTTRPPTTTTTTTTTTAPPEPPVLQRGAEGPVVTALQERLLELNFWVPAADGRYGPVTAQAVMAFQKSAGIARDGIAGPQTMAVLDDATPVAAREGGDHVEVDLERQLMLVVHDGRTFVFNTSTGTQGWRTPPGRFEITRQIDGVRRAPLGDLYRPKYFNRGIALHGSASIPGHPASHGCTRLHDTVVDMIWADGLAPIGTPVWVH
ncbi:MAG: L,D-transpeptidase family protein [Acidimicrobiales bacterium]|nr:L,D-transpeptidase family protein [Acidimicrobiales bacterium]